MHSAKQFTARPDAQRLCHVLMIGRIIVPERTAVYQKITD
jgi:hypothetical protein